MIVLFVLFALFVLTAPFLATARNADRASRHLADDAQARLALDAAARQARAQPRGVAPGDGHDALPRRHRGAHAAAPEPSLS
jgi:hypothetical protein